MRINYVLIDFESVQPESLGALAHDHFRVLVFVGANQARLPIEIAVSLQRLGSRAEYIQISGNGPNALDFHIAYYIGYLAAKDPSAYFHIVSKDTGFDPLVRHLKTRKVFAGRVRAIADIPAVKASNSKSPKERMQVILARLQQPKASRPRTVKTLSATIASLFQNQLPDAEVASLIQSLIDHGYMEVVGTKISYVLPSDA